MLKDALWSEDRSYRNSSDDEPIEFYLDALTNSSRFDLLLGYFSSAAINVLSLGFAKFLHGDGRLRIIANNILSTEDKNSVRDGMLNNVTEGLLDITNIKEIKASLDEYGRHFFECISWLISNDRIDIIVIKPKDRKGISHYKSGVFFDGVDSVAFKSSCNFTAFGLLENLEELDAFLSWENSRSSKLIKRQNEYFDKIFSGQADFVEYLSVDDIVIAIKDNFADKSYSELLIDEADLLSKKIGYLRKPTLKKRIARIADDLIQISRKPKFPFSEGPRAYQKEAHANWVKNDHKGIFSMATGTGKTLTSLNCVLQQFNETGSYCAVIVVPTISLINQWKLECERFNFKNVIAVNSRTKWANDISFFNTASKLDDTSFIVIVTYSSFHRKAFQDHFKRLPEGTILVADEAHNLGSGKVKKILPGIHLKKRIGLSATINRKYDDEGNAAIQEFFNDSYPYVINYTMSMALDKGWLCQYKYYPHLVELEEDEFGEYLAISKRLMRHFDTSTGRYKKNQEVEMLLLSRKRIIHKARRKLNKLKSILKDEYDNKGHLKYSLVYVPEGDDPDYEIQDQFEENETDQRLIHSYTKAISEIDFSVMVKQFTSGAPNRETILKNFEKGDLHVLTSMKCLDEGVDIPRSELAIFCSSTGNPRQFIQRRGRVLRTHKEKDFATIHDLVVVPKIEKKTNHYEMERGLVKKELERVVDFSFLSMNKMDTFSILNDLLDYYNLNLFEINDQNS